MYTRVCVGLNDKGKLVKTDKLGDELANLNKDGSKDIYYSIFEYSDEHYKHFLEHGSIAGITDVTTSKLVFDFDCLENLELAKSEALELVSRLETLTGDINTIQIYFSGKKGFTVLVDTNLRFTPPQLKELCQNQIGKELSTLDKTLYNASRILRCPFTKHQESGLYKVPLSYKQIQYSVDDIKIIAKSLDSANNIEYAIAHLNTDIIPKDVNYKEHSALGNVYTDYTIKPRWLTNCRWSLQNGNFTQGNRNSAFLCLAATYKNQGFTPEITYRMLKGVAQIQATLTDTDRYSDNELYSNIVLQIYGPGWNNGQFSCRDKNSWLYDYCKSLGEHSCKHDEKNDQYKPQTLLGVVDKFKDFVKNIDKNTITVGIPEIDEALPITSGLNLMLLGPAGSGKTAIALKILNNTSKSGVKSVMASLDMSRNRLFEKVMYRLSNLPRKDLYKIYQDDKEENLVQKLQQEYGNVFFYDKSSPSVQDIRDYVLACQEECGEKIKLLMIDYFERVSCEYSDDTQASKKIASELQDLCNDLDIALVTLVQPNKMGLSSGINSPLRDYTKIKGSSFMYQSARAIISIWRPFGVPHLADYDKFLNMAILKNDLGELQEFTFKWNGKRGDITTMTDEEKIEYDSYMDMLESQQDDKKGGWN